jgi:cellulose biosynthesis protein BcsQ
MSSPTPVIAFFNNKGGVGKTSMVYHVSWMLTDRGFRVIAADLDPQANLTAAFLDEDRLEEVMPIDDHPLTVVGAIQPLQRGVGDVADPHIEIINERLGLIVGDMDLSSFEDELSDVWPKCLDRKERSFRVISAFWRILQRAAEIHQADVILIDLGPNLGAINRTALIASDHVVIPLGPDLFSLQGLRNLGPALRRWREGWQERLTKNPVEGLGLPPGNIQPLGYMVLRHSIRLDRPVKAFERWMARIPSVYREAVLDKRGTTSATIDNDPECIAKLRDYRSLMPLAQEARKPMFFLKPADGALGAHTYAVADAYKEFRIVAEKIAKKAGIKSQVTDTPGLTEVVSPLKQA